jgi:hypothetical protein
MLMIFCTGLTIFLASPIDSPAEENSLIFLAIFTIISPLLLYLGYRFVQRFDPDEESTISKIYDKMNQKIAKSIETRKKIERKKEDQQQNQYNQERDQLLFQRFHQLLQNHPVIAKIEVIKTLGITNDELFVRLIEWNKLIPFQVKNNIIYNDLEMTTNSIICTRCGESNLLNAEFCIACGLELQKSE